MADPFERDLPPYVDDPNVPNPFASPLAEEARGSEFVTRADVELNPWISMWMKPRQTVRQLIDAGSTKYVLLLAALGGISGTMDEVMEPSLEFGERLEMLVIAVVVGAIVGILWLYLFGWLGGVAGRSLGGIARAREVRTALAWSNVPGVWLLPFNLGFALLFVVLGPEQLFGNIFEEAVGEDGFDFRKLPPWVLLLGFVSLMIAIWQFVISCQAVGEAHQISSGRGFLTLLLSGLMFTGLALVIVIPVIFLLFAFTGPP